MKFLASLFFFVSVSILASSGLFVDRSFIALVLNRQNGAHYGDPLSREINTRDVESVGVLVVYKDPSELNTRTEKSNAFKKIAKILNNVNPGHIYISKEDTGILNYLKTEHIDKVRVAGDILSGRSLRHAKKIVNFLKGGNVRHETIIVLHDETLDSMSKSSKMVKSLIASGINAKKIKETGITSFQGIRIFLGTLLKSKNVILINKLGVLRDVELGKNKFSNDIKKELNSANSHFLDIGFGVGQYNEAIVIEDDARDLYEIFFGKTCEVRVNVLVNKDRLKSMGLNYITVNYFHNIGGLIP